MDRLGPNWPKPPASDQGLSDAMTAFWTSFASTGAPSAAGAPDWRPYGSTGAYMDFKAAPQMSKDLFPGMYAFNEQVVCRRRAQGDQPWHWNVGLWSPKMPPKAPNCGG